MQIKTRAMTLSLLRTLTQDMDRQRKLSGRFPRVVLTEDDHRAIVRYDRDIYDIHTLEPRHGQRGGTLFGCEVTIGDRTEVLDDGAN